MADIIKLEGALGKAIDTVKAGSLFDAPANNGSRNEITLEQAIGNEEAAKRGEITLAADELDSLTRHILIGATAYGIHRLPAIVAYSGATEKQVREVIEEYREEIKEGTYCLTKSELVAKLSILSTTANKDADKLTAIKLLMDYRGLSAPEGGSRNFKRTVLKFATGQ